MNAFQDKNRILQTVRMDSGFFRSQRDGGILSKALGTCRRGEEDPKGYPVQVYDDADVGLFAEASGTGIDEEGEYNQRT
jgi:hypothetical protein